MQFLVHPIPPGPLTPYDALLSRINRFRTKEFLKLCNAVSNWIEGRPLSELLIDVPANPRYGVRIPCKIYLEPWAIPFLAKASILRSSDMRQVSPTADDLRCLAFMFANLRGARATTAGPYSTLVRTVWEQFPYQEQLASMIPRAKVLLLDGNREFSNPPLDPEAEWIDATGMDLEKFMVIGFGYFAGAMAHTSLTRYFAASGHMAGSISPEDCDKFLKRTAATYNEFRELSQEFEVTDPLYIKTEFNILNKRPLVAVGGELMAPVPRLVARRLTEGLYFDLMDLFSGQSSNRFLDYFGQLFERYVGKILKWTFGQDRVIPEPLYGKGEKRGPDWIVLDGDTALLFECRSSRLRLSTRVYARHEELIRDSERIFLETLRKYPGKIAKLKSGVYGIDASAIDHFEPIIVTYDPIFVEPYFREIARKDFAKRGLEPFEDYHLMGIVDLEALSAWHSVRSMRQVLLDRKTESTSAAEDFSAFIRRYSMEHNLAVGHPLLEQVQDEFFEKHFKIPGGTGGLSLDDGPAEFG